jgi:hypothetical protein
MLVTCSGKVWLKLIQPYSNTQIPAKMHQLSAAGVVMPATGCCISVRSNLQLLAAPARARAAPQVRKSVAPQQLAVST